ncbi:MAG: fimbrillin family protein [bacterium]|nr:fimbrillin family protein [bacterium]
MKAIQFLTLTALGAALFASCSNEEELTRGSYPNDNIIRVTAGVNNMTRGNEVTTALNKDFSLNVVNSTNGNYSYANEIFSLNGGTEWSSTNKLLWENLATPVEIVALYPATDANTFDGVYSKGNKSYGTITYSVNSDQSTADEANDLLLYHNASFVPKNDLEAGKLDIQFNHAFCRVDIEVIIASEFNATNGLAENPIQGIKIEGTKTTAEIGFTSTAPFFTVTPSASGEVTSIIPTLDDFTPTASATEHAVAKYSCIVIPQTATLKVVLHTSDREYEWTGTEMALESGKQYTLQLNLKKSATTRNFILRERK